MSSKLKLWHIATEEPPRDSYILVMYHHPDFKVRYDVEHTPHIADWKHYADYHCVTVWCAIADIHRFGMHEPEVSDAIVEEVARSLRECKEAKGRFGGVSYYHSWQVYTDYLLALLLLTRSTLLNRKQRKSLADLLPEIKELEETIKVRKDFVTRAVRRTDMRRRDMAELVERLGKLDDALDNIKEMVEVVKGA
ncbi:MAG: hypothetical protein IKB71_07580 [Lentisphaeria bacterium]|nr:hypothetical protein [Lentisphaeria bacterium]